MFNRFMLKKLSTSLVVIASLLIVQAPFSDLSLIHI